MLIHFSFDTLFYKRKIKVSIKTIKEVYQYKKNKKNLKRKMAILEELTQI